MNLFKFGCCAVVLFVTTQGLAHAQPSGTRSHTAREALPRDMADMPSDPSTMGTTRNTDEQLINHLFQELEQALINQSAPDHLLLPSLTSKGREKESQKALRPYAILQFEYNIANLQRTTANGAMLPLIVKKVEYCPREWQTHDLCTAGKI